MKTQMHSIKTRFRSPLSIAIAIGLTSGVLQCESALAEPMSFTMLGNFKGGVFTRPMGISADGSIIVGYGVGTAGQFGFRWTNLTGLQTLESYQGDPGSRAYDISPDGTVIVGITRISIASERAVSWSSIDNPQLITIAEGIPLNEARGVSANGSTIVGATTHQGYLINENGVMVLPGLAVGHDTYPFGVSDDGSTVVGYSTDSANHLRAVRWTAAQGIENLGVLPGFATSWAFGVSADGSTVVGRLEPGGGNYSYRAFRWTASGGMQNLGSLPGYNQTGANAASADGRIVVGSADDAFGNRTWIWTAEDGMRDLLDVLAPVLPANCGCTLAGVLISDDGRVLTGQFSSPSDSGAFVAVIPEPGTGIMLLIGLSSILASRRNRVRLRTT